MAVEAIKALAFRCEKCGYVNFTEYNLDTGEHEGYEVMEDRIDCEKCNHENHVVEDL